MQAQVKWPAYAVQQTTCLEEPWPRQGPRVLGSKPSQPQSRWHCLKLQDFVRRVPSRDVDLWLAPPLILAKAGVFNKVSNVVKIKYAEVDTPRKTPVLAPKTPTAAVEEERAGNVWFPRTHVGKLSLLRFYECDPIISQTSNALPTF